MGLFLFQLKNELIKLFSRKRTHLGFFALAGVEFLIPCLMRMEPVKHVMRLFIEARGYPFEAYYSGLSIGLITLRATIILIGALYIALVAGDIVSKEVEEGTMRMLLARPVTRFRILALKYLASLIYTLVLTLFLVGGALATGLLMYGTGGFFVFGLQERIFEFHPFWPGMMRLLATVPLLVLSLLTINSAAFCLSCFNIKPAAATVATLSIFFVDLVLRAMPFFESLDPYFITTRMSSWMHLFRQEIPWAQVAADYIPLLAADATLFVVGWMSFERRDFKS